MTVTRIEWADRVWNPVAGCERVSPGCDRCYAIRQAVRMQRRPDYEGTVARRDDGALDWTGMVRTLPHRLTEPHRWPPSRIFVNSMSDLFHADVPEHFLSAVFDVMWACGGDDETSDIVNRSLRRLGERPLPAHTFMVLTKRPERLERYARTGRLGHVPPSNVWLGVSVESPEYYSRIRHLQRTPAALRFLSCEPLLAPLPDLPLGGIGWVIVGGESGPGARPMHLEWVTDIIDACRRAGVPVFVKQLGSAWARMVGNDPRGRDSALWPDARGGDWECWPTHLRVREEPDVPARRTRPGA